MEHPSMLQEFVLQAVPHIAIFRNGLRQEYLSGSGKMARLPVKNRGYRLEQIGAEWLFN